MVGMGTKTAPRVGTLTDRELPTTQRPETAVRTNSSYRIEPDIPIPPPLTFSEEPSRFQANALAPAPLQSLLGGWDISAMLNEETLAVEPVAPQFTAEHAIDFLSNLAHGLSEEERCQRVQELLRGITTDESGTASELVGEAAQLIVQIRQEVRELEENFQRCQTDDTICIQVLEERLTRLRSQIKERQTTIGDQRQRLRTRLDEMMGIIVFFDRYQSFLRHAKYTQAPAEAPPYLREDAVRNLLKHNGRLTFS